MPRRSSGRSGGYRGSYGSRSYSMNRSTPRGSTYSSYSSAPKYTGQSRTSTGSTLPTQRPGIGLGSALATGMAFGGGSAIAHNVVRSMMGGGGGYYPTESTQTGGPVESVNNDPYQAESQKQDTQKYPCYDYNVKFVDCLKMNENDISKCQKGFDELRYCERSLI